MQPSSKPQCSLLQAYQAALGDLQTGDFDSTAPRAYSSLYAELAATNAGALSCWCYILRFCSARAWIMTTVGHQTCCTMCNLQPMAATQWQLQMLGRMQNLLTVLRMHLGVRVHKGAYWMGP